jgi:hypothetical protein
MNMMMMTMMTNFIFSDLGAKALWFIQNLIMPCVEKGEAHFSLKIYENNCGGEKQVI